LSRNPGAELDAQLNAAPIERLASEEAHAELYDLLVEGHAQQTASDTDWKEAA
jgi:hypothetical protein